MADAGRKDVDESDVVLVSDAMVERQDDRRFGNRYRKAELWLLVDAPRWGVIAALAPGVYAATMLVGTFGPASVQQYLLDGIAIADACIELQPGVITTITIVLGINQLVLSPSSAPSATSDSASRTSSRTDATSKRARRSRSRCSPSP